MYQEKIKEISKVINNYFKGLYEGDIELLKECFSTDAYLHGDINNDEYVKSISEFLDGIAQRKSPKDSNEINKMKILNIETINSVAIAKVHVPMLGYNYYDFLSLSVLNGEWKIVDKIFTHVNYSC